MEEEFYLKKERQAYDALRGDNSYNPADYLLQELRAYEALHNKKDWIAGFLSGMKDNRDGKPPVDRSTYGDMRECYFIMGAFAARDANAR